MSDSNDWIVRLIEEKKLQIEKHPKLHYMEFIITGGGRHQLLCPEGKKKLDGDTLMGHILIDSLEKDNKKLEEALRVAREAVGFYGDENNYLQSYDDGLNETVVVFNNKDDVEYVYDTDNSIIGEIAGKKSREAEKQIDEMLNGKV